MEKLEEIRSLINKASWQASLYYVGLFYKDTELISKTSSRSRNLASYFGRLIEKSLELNDVLPNFREEFMFSEGKDYSLFVYYINRDVSIGMIHIGKPNFSLLKVTASDLAKSLQPFVGYLTELYAQKVTQQPVTEVPQETSHVKKDLEKPDSLTYNIDSDLEDILKSPNQISTENHSNNLELVREENQKPDEELNFELPSLEDLFQKDMAEDTVETLPEEEDKVENFEEIIEKISLEFVREIGPFGKFLFKKKKDEFFKGKAGTKFELLKFVNVLSEEITIQQRKENFLERVKSHLLNL